MREILFRGKRTDNGEFVESRTIVENICESGEKCYFIGAGQSALQYVNQDGNLVAVETTGECLFYACDPETVGQFTGLTDKNGKKIFEGDIIKFHKYRYEPDWVGVVEYENCLYLAKGTMPLAYEKRIGEDAYYCPFEVQISGIDKDTIEVIGNIYDNPELLEVNN